MESAIAKLNKYRMSPRKVRLVADMIRGMEVVKAINLLKNDAKKASKPMAKLVLSSVANWHQKNGADFEGDLYVDKIMVDSSAMLKRIKPAPQGRAHRIRKRFSRITIIVNSLNIEKTSSSLKVKNLDTFKKQKNGESGVKTKVKLQNIESKTKNLVKKSKELKSDNNIETLNTETLKNKNIKKNETE